MDKISSGVCFAVASSLSFLGYCFTGSETYAKLLMMVVCVDVVTGVISAAFEGKVSSRSFFGNLSKGLVRKMLMLLLLVCVSYGSMVTNTIWARDSMLVFYIGGEALSILENLRKCGVPFPQFLTSIFESMKDRGDSGDGGE